MPQFDPTYFASQIFWLVVSFAALYIAMSMIVIPRISDVLESRRSRIENDLTRAERLRGEAEKVREQYEDSIEKARASAQEAHRNMTEDVAVEAQRLSGEAAQKISSQIAEAEKRIAAARGEAMAEIESVARDAAKLTIAKLAGVAVDDKTVAAAVRARATS